MTSKVLSAILAASLSGCASTPYHAYKRSHPDWVPAIPPTDIALDEVLAAVYSPPTGAYQLVISKLSVFVTDGASWSEVDADAITAGTLVPSDDKDYAVMALVWCASEVDLERYTGERASWYLLPKNRVVAFDQYDFTERCVVGNEYHPATGSHVPAEQKLSAMASELTRSPVHAAHLYMKGVALAGVGRASEAQAMLAAGDATAARGLASNEPRFDPGKAVAVGDDRADLAARRELLRALDAIDARPSSKSP